MEQLLKNALILLLMTISVIYSQEVPVPERFLRPRTFNPHPYTADAGLRDYSIELEPNVEPEAHPTLDQHPYPLFQRIDTRNNDNSPVQFPVVPPVLKKTLKSKTSSKYIQVPKNYAFSYAVKDHQSGDDFSHSQAHDGKATQGEYRVKLPDGRIQVVSYTADNKGYRADVRYDGERNEKDVYRNEQLPYPHPVPGYISTTLFDKKVQKVGPTTPTFLVYTPNSGYRPAPAPPKYKTPPPALPKISPTISTDGSLGYQNPVYYNTYNEVHTSQPSDIKYVSSEEFLQSITAAKYLQDVLPKQDHRTKSAPSLRDYATVHQNVSPNPGPIFQAVLSSTSAPKISEDENNSDGIDYSSELHSTVAAPQAIYPSSTPSTIYQDSYYALHPSQTSQKVISPNVKYIYLTSSQYDAYKDH
ncbi:uncharacterized protein LOC142320251 [Lycorma delicatula]|uniref:uncharacterized protein LOC142320251 n=1 Tax=Lycorma delicatula TaxID=130591 RepID=UPI003F512232